MQLLLSGAIAVGKSAVAEELALMSGGSVLRVRQALAAAVEIAPDDRRELQIRGAELDKRTHGRWLLHYIEANLSERGPLIVDALRTRRQTLPILTGLPDSHLIHLTAHVGTRRVRYALGARSDRLKASTTFDQAIAHETERASDEIRDLAELDLVTDDLTPAMAAGLIAARFELTSPGGHS